MMNSVFDNWVLKAVFVRTRKKLENVPFSIFFYERVSKLNLNHIINLENKIKY